LRAERPIQKNTGLAGGRQELIEKITPVEWQEFKPPDKKE
jgi:hypothetical protein